MLSCLKTIECPNCGTKIDYGEGKRSEIEEKITISDKALSEYREEFSKLNDKNIPYFLPDVEKLLHKLGQIEMVKAQLKKFKFDLNSEYSKLREIDENLEYMPQESDLQDKLVKIEKKKILLQNKLTSENLQKDIVLKAKICKKEREELKAKLDKCEKYISLFNMKNLDSLPYRLLVKISEFLSTETIRFKTYSQLGNGNLVLDISCELKVGEEFINYDGCSHGQKTMMDFFILSRFLELLNGVGVVSIDEGLSVLNPEMYNDVCEIIKELQSYNILITSHQLGFTDYDSLMTCTLEANGRTKIELS